MAFETSEAFYAGLSTFSTKVLERAKTNQESFNELYDCLLYTSDAADEE